jgi:hypothetical protein
VRGVASSGSVACLQLKLRPTELCELFSVEFPSSSHHLSGSFSFVTLFEGGLNLNRKIKLSVFCMGVVLFVTLREVVGGWRSLHNRELHSLYTTK